MFGHNHQSSSNTTFSYPYGPLEYFSKMPAEELRAAAIKSPKLIESCRHVVRDGGEQVRNLERVTMREFKLSTPTAAREKLTDYANKAANRLKIENSVAESETKTIETLAIKYLNMISAIAKAESMIQIITTAPQPSKTTDNKQSFTNKH